MADLALVAPAFVEMAHRIVWCTAASVDPAGRPRTRILHPLWILGDDGSLTGWIATGRTPAKAADLEANPALSCSYWAPSHDTCVADVATTWFDDDSTCTWLWDAMAHAPAPVGYDPEIIPPWSGGPTSPAFSALRLTPWRLRVFPGTALVGAGGDVLTWRS